jgi:hypothetical protein
MGSSLRRLSMTSYFTTAEVADRYRTAASTVRFWRHIGYGPKGTKVGRRVLYPEAEVRKFDAELAAKAASGTDTETAPRESCQASSTPPIESPLTSAN